MKNYTFKEWSEFKTISEGVDSDPQPGDFVITNPKAFMDSVVRKSGSLKNDGVSNLSNFSRFEVKDVDGRKVKGSVHHRTYSGGHSKKFNSYDFLDVTPAFNVDGKKVWINNAPGRRATAHYINKMYPVWAAKMGMEGFANPDEQMAAQQASDEREAEREYEAEMMQQMQMQEPEPEPEMQQEPNMPQTQYQKYPMQQPQHQVQPQHQQTAYRQVQPQSPYRQVQPQAQQAAPWQKPSEPTYTMQNREVMPSSVGQGDANFGFDSNDSYDSYDQDSIPMNTNDAGQDTGSFDTSGFDDMRLAASYDANIDKTYKYYPE